MDNFDIATLFPRETRPLGLACIGQTGYGKTSFFEQLIRSDIDQGISCIVLDLHGDLANNLLDYTSAKLAPEQVVLLEIREDASFGLNLYECPDPHSFLAVDKTVDIIVSLFSKLWGEHREFFSIIEEVIGASAYTLIANQEVAGKPYTMAEIPILFDEPDPVLKVNLLQQKLLLHVTNSEVRRFWQNYNRRTDLRKLEFTQSSIIRLSQFLKRQFIYRAVASSSTTIPFRDVLENPGRVLLIRLPIGKLGEENAAFLGAIFLSVLTNLIYERESLSLAEREQKQVHLYLDEYASVCSSKTSDLLRQGRKYGVGTAVAFQSFADLKDEQNKSAVLQVGTLVAFQVIGGTDAELFAKQLPITPQPVERKLQMKTEPAYKEWDEEVWIENGEEQYNQALAANEEEINELRSAYKAAQETAELFKTTTLAVASAVESITNCYSPSELYPEWCIEGHYDGEEVMISKNFASHNHGQRTLFYSIESGRGESDWTDANVENKIGDLVEVKERTLTASFTAYAPGWSGYDNDWRKKEITYTYLEREERYLLDKHALSRFHRRASGIYSDLSSEISATVIDLLADFWVAHADSLLSLFSKEGIWFIPQLEPDPINMLRYSKDEQHVPVPQYVLNDWERGRFTKEVIAAMINYPPLARFLQPKVGEKRKQRGWTQYGTWRLPNIDERMEWLQKWYNIYRKRFEETREVFFELKEQEKQLQRQLELAQQNTAARREEIYKQYRTTVHHKEYIGLRAITEEKVRESVTHSSSSSTRPSSSRWGPSLLVTSSDSTSETETMFDIPLYEWVDGVARPYADTRLELETELATLPRFTCLIQHIDTTGNTQTVKLKLPAPDPVTRSQEGFKQIQQYSNRYYRPWEEVEQEIQQRQYIPPPEEKNQDGVQDKGKKQRKLAPERGKPLSL